MEALWLVVDFVGTLDSATILVVSAVFYHIEICVSRESQVRNCTHSSEGVMERSEIGCSRDAWVQRLDGNLSPRLNVTVKKVLDGIRAFSDGFSTCSNRGASLSYPIFLPRKI